MARRCAAANSMFVPQRFSGVSPHPHARQVEFREQSLMSTRSILPVLTVPSQEVHHPNHKYVDVDVAWSSHASNRTCMEKPLPTTATTSLRTTHLVSAARSPPDHFPGTASCEHALQIPLLRTADQRDSAVLARKHVCLSLTVCRSTQSRLIMSLSGGDRRGTWYTTVSLDI